MADAGISKIGFHWAKAITAAGGGCRVSGASLGVWGHAPPGKFCKKSSFEASFGEF